MKVRKLLCSPSVLFIISYSILIITIKTIVPYQNFISFDNFGYYMHLPAKYIYDDEALKSGWFEEITSKYQNKGYYSQTAKTDNGNRIMRFYKGMSYVWTPPFALAHLYAKKTEFDADGFSMPYSKTLIYYGALFTILGLVISRKILRYYFNERVTTITLAVFYLGTSLLYFGFLGSDVPHTYLFTFFVALIYGTIKWHEKQKFGYMLIIAVSYGFIISIRPSDFFIIIISALWGITGMTSLKNKLNLLDRNKFQLMAAVVISSIFIIPQLFYYYKVTGNFIVNIYDDPGNIIDFRHPLILSILFGFRKGWFIYSPLIALGFIGLIAMWRQNKGYMFAAIIYLSITIYLVASFYNLFSFGWRAFIQSSAVLVLPLGFLINYLDNQKLFLKATVGLFVCFFVGLNIHQAYQLKNRVLNASRTTKEYYFKVLLKNKISEEDKDLLFPDCQMMGPKRLPTRLSFKKTILSNFDFNDITYSETQDILNRGALRLNKQNPFSPSMKDDINNICNSSYCYIEISAIIYSSCDIGDSLRFVVITKAANDEIIKYDAFSLKESGYVLQVGKWNKVTTYHISPEFLKREGSIKAYVWYTGSSDLWIDDLSFSIYEQTKD